MDPKYQIAIAVSSCFVGILVGILIVRVARRKISRRKSPPDDDVNTDWRRRSNLGNRHLMSPRDHRQTDENLFEPARTHIELETFSNAKFKHRHLPTRDDGIVYPMLSPSSRSMEPTADYPVTPVISRQTSLPSRSVTTQHAHHVTTQRDHPVTTQCDHPVTIPQADYSDDDTLLDYPVTRNSGSDATGKLQPTRHPVLKRTTSNPVVTYSERNLNTRRSERHNIIRHSDSGHDMDRPITDRFIHSRLQTSTGYPVTFQSSHDSHVINTHHHHETQPFPDYPSFELVPDIPNPDYH